MNVKRKIIFKEALFTVPFLLIASVISLLMMFKSGRNPLDIEQFITLKFRSDASAEITDYLKKETKEYEVYYYYCDDDSSQMYARFNYEGGGDDPKCTLTLYETRDGFDPGVYSTAWFFGEKYIMYWPLNSTSDSEGFEKYLAGDVPLMDNLVTSYSWDGVLLSNGADEETPKGYTFLGIKLFVWNYLDDGVIRENFVWGVGGNPFQFYSYIQGSQGEYKKVTLI